MCFAHLWVGLGGHAPVQKRHERPLLHDEGLAVWEAYPEAIHLQLLQVLCEGAGRESDHALNS